MHYITNEQPQIIHQDSLQTNCGDTDFCDDYLESIRSIVGVSSSEESHIVDSSLNIGNFITYLFKEEQKMLIQSLKSLTNCSHNIASIMFESTKPVGMISCDYLYYTVTMDGKLFVYNNAQDFRSALNCLNKDEFIETYANCVEKADIDCLQKCLLDINELLLSLENQKNADFVYIKNLYDSVNKFEKAIKKRYNECFFGNAMKLKKTARQRLENNLLNTSQA
ncbi:hypothetical protein AB837_00437 [bacterium AB1]|nr:hypothetical protein AB837_00437 [bacterium AB1]